MLQFKDWLSAQESTAFTRSRQAASLGLGTPIASIDSHSTATPFERKNAKSAFDSTHKKHRKKGTSHKPSGLISVGPDGGKNPSQKKSKIAKPDIPHPTPDKSKFDSFIMAVDALKSDWEQLEKIADKKSKEPKKPEKPDDKKGKPFGIPNEPEDDIIKDKPEEDDKDQDQEDQKDEKPDKPDKKPNDKKSNVEFRGNSKPIRPIVRIS